VEDHSWATGALIFYNVFKFKILIQNSTYEDIVAVPEEYNKLSSHYRVVSKSLNTKLHIHMNALILLSPCVLAAEDSLKQNFHNCAFRGGAYQHVCMFKVHLINANEGNIAHSLQDTQKNNGYMLVHDNNTN